ncbi:MAG: FAD-dependent oxidoreductase [Thermoanaerobaculales bacterium]
MAEPRFFLTDAQLRAELERCVFCESKPCQAACPADCSPADFIMAVRVGAASDFRRAAAMIMAANPLGEVCGVVCPDSHCMAACARATLDTPVNIPAVQATIIAKARTLGVTPAFDRAGRVGPRVAVVGGGPAGLGAAAVLAQEDCRVGLFAADRVGGAAALVPEFRLGKDVLAADAAFVAGLGEVTVRRERASDPAALLGQGYDAVVVATGLDEPLRLGIPGEELAVPWTKFLADPSSIALAGRRVAVIGGGAVAADCAVTAATGGAAQVEMFALEKLSEMPLTAAELRGLVDAGVAVSGRTRVTAIAAREGTIGGLAVRKVTLSEGAAFHPRAVVDEPGSEQARDGLEVVIVAIGARPSVAHEAGPGVFFAGDIEHGPTTVVEAVAAGKNAARDALAYLAEHRGEPPASLGEGTTVVAADPAPGATGPVSGSVKSTVVLRGYRRLPVPLDAEFFGRPIASPFLLSAAPPTDGYGQMRKAYEAGWAGGVMKTSFDNVAIHIPSRYMFAFDQRTFGNCDNVSGHALDRVCAEVERLRREFPDRLTLASTGGPVTGHDDADRAVWQSNTGKLEAAGACGVEYSLSCPQGGDGTKGDIVSQDAELTAKIIGWVMEVSDPEVPKLFKLSAAVTSIVPIVTAIKQVFDRYPTKKAGVTLANTFPTLAFRPGSKAAWDEGIVVGMSGAGVTPISNLTLANVSHLGVVVSGNGGPMDYRAAAGFLALGARTVQFCSIAMKHGVGIVDELHSGLSHLLEAHGWRSVGELVGCALPNPITAFIELPAAKQISTVEASLCARCGNCTRCPYLAISLDDEQVPRTDPARCVACSFCTLMCFTGALSMRERTPEEAAALVEA